MPHKHVLRFFQINKFLWHFYIRDQGNNLKIIYIQNKFIKTIINESKNKIYYEKYLRKLKLTKNYYIK